MITAYCKKCGKDVPVSEICPYCGKKLVKSSARVAWCVEHQPLGDWICWNSFARILLPVYGFIILILLLGDWILNGSLAFEQTIRDSLLPVTLIFLFTILLLFLILFFQGKDLIDCVVDNRGVHITTYLVDPTPLKLFLRFCSPEKMKELNDSDEIPLVMIQQKELLWRELSRVQLWPEKNIVLLYAPHWWMRLCIYCTPFTWNDTLTYMKDKVGKKRNLLLPPQLIQEKAVKTKPTEKSSAAQVDPTSLWNEQAEMPEPFPDALIPPYVIPEGAFPGVFAPDAPIDSSTDSAPTASDSSNISMNEEKNIP